jgi:uncharacterized protein YyaL (SSP411 family)
MPNRLIHETSPYLKQHAQNPVDWYSWSPEALQRARDEDRPIFLSIGYSACHWCHVMEHESFEDPRIAAKLNAAFVNIKVDREERPDLDQIYMNAIQMISGRGGWPMSVFLTPDLQPFFGGTYWPPAPKYGMPGFDQVIDAVIDAWHNRRALAIEQAQQLTERIAQVGNLSGAGGELSLDLLTKAESQLTSSFDPRFGGFGDAPKFPHPNDLRVLLRIWRRNTREVTLRMVTHTLDRMAAGGMYDQLGGGFHRYSVDERWLVPHFEKMLYDNGLLTSAYVEAFQATGNPEYARIARETCDYVLREMTSPEGGFYSAQDADSEGEEGKFYVWTSSEIEEILGADRARVFNHVYDVTPGGNFEGHSILNRPHSNWEQAAQLANVELAVLRDQLQQDRAKLLAVRNGRVWPARDDKILVSWNALMIEALAQAATPLDEPRFLQAAQNAADFLLTKLRAPGGRLLHGWAAGQAKLPAYLDDYAYLAQALVTLYEACFDERYLTQAIILVEEMIAHFSDLDAGGFFYTADDHEQLIARNKDALDSSVPSGNAMAAMVLLRLGKLCGRSDFYDRGVSTLQAFSRVIERSPTGTAQMLLALDFHAGPTPELILLGEPRQETLTELSQRFLPNRVLAWRPTTAAPKQACTDLAPAFAGKEAQSPGPTLYVCERFACQQPVTGPDAVAAKIASLE